MIISNIKLKIKFNRSQTTLTDYSDKIIVFLNLHEIALFVLWFLDWQKLVEVSETFDRQSSIPIYILFWHLDVTSYGRHKLGKM